jgi:hypothetical protein
MADTPEVFLSEDAAVPGQKFTLLSFLSPERVLADKNLFFFEEFVKGYEFTVRFKGLEDYLMTTVRQINEKLDKEAGKFDALDMSGASDICRASRIQVGGVMEEFQNFVKKNKLDLKKSSLKERYDDFMFASRVDLEDKFYAKNEFKTTVRGLKIRGTYGSHEEAVARAKRLQKLDPIHNIFVAEVGKWLPWDPETTDVKDEEYAEDELNVLMKKYKENQEARENISGTLHEEHERIRKSRPAVPMWATNEEIAAAVPDMFGPQKDLAIQRKEEAAAGL